MKKIVLLVDIKTTSIPNIRNIATNFTNSKKQIINRYFNKKLQLIQNDIYNIIILIKSYS